ncbi:MAG: S41 family peptidase [Pyramidobacter sp.]|nr:S41 family peptidase [Pyramidobacter sp.]
MKAVKKYRDIVLGIIVGIVLTALIPVVHAGSSELAQVAPFSSESLWLLKQAKVLVETYQVDAASKDLEESEVVYGAMRGMLDAWKDPYTRFLDPDELEEEKTSIDGSFGGLGVTIGNRDGKTLVISPMEGTPADKAGLRPMDEIVKVNDEVVVGWELNKVVKLLRGDPGTEVTIWVRRPKASKLLEKKIVRDIIKIKTVSSEMLSGDIGHIRLRQFIKTSAADVGSAVIDLKNRNAKGLILDLRNNGGGIIDGAVDICDLFIDGGLVVSTKGRVDSANEEYYVHDGVLTKLPLVVLINEGSASASEITAGALRDRNKTLLVGAKSFGKGSVQVLFNLSDGSGLFVTTARYFTPSGVRIDHVGLSPDIYVQSQWDAEETADPIEAAVSNEQSPAKAQKPADLQLEKAREIVLKLIAGADPESLKDPVPVVASSDVEPTSTDTSEDKEAQP